MQLQGKIALIPGASRAIGREIARKLAKEGVNLILPTFDWPESVQDMEQEFKGLDIEVLILPCDLREPNQVQKMVAAIKKRFGALHILVNNIERGGMPIVHGSYDLAHNHEQWDLEIDTTLKAKWLLFHHCLPMMKQSGSGAIVNISSISALTGRSGPAALLFNDAYSAANRAISSFTETWAREAAPEIRVNELMLGLIEHRHGERTRGWSAMKDEEKQELLTHTLLQRTGTAEEVATATLFLVRDADFMTGTVLRMDGGFCLGGEQVPDIAEGILTQEG
ncbi:MAG: SDR family oxidoreductase [Proteobacteria bacterium]|nr:SDR family oxidoreductase [Pseudomonadota bacterium]MBU1648784.1 SDR family oxidoreductase [Pseudomonadota bacterium]MBU1986940.1 SDR family oxidoreductase [Pseudomonadota bacterium]